MIDCVASAKNLFSMNVQYSVTVKQDLFTCCTPSSTPVYDLLTKRPGFSRRKVSSFYMAHKISDIFNLDCQCSHTCMSVRMVCIEPVNIYSSFHVKAMILDDLGDDGNIYFSSSVIITYQLLTFRFMACERDC